MSLDYLSKISQVEKFNRTNFRASYNSPAICRSSSNSFLLMTFFDAGRRMKREDLLLLLCAFVLKFPTASAVSRILTSKKRMSSRCLIASS